MPRLADVRVAADNLTGSQKQLVKFGLIGVVAVFTDLCMYWVFLNLLPENVISGSVRNEVVAKALSFVCGLMVTYHLNKRWTWRRKDRSNRRLVKFMTAYGISLLLNVAINTGALELLHHQEPFTALPFKYVIAFVLATGICASFTFVGQKFWIFRTKEEAESELDEPAQGE